MLSLRIEKLFGFIIGKRKTKKGFVFKILNDDLKIYFLNKTAIQNADEFSFASNNDGDSFTDELQKLIDIIEVNCLDFGSNQ